MPFVISQMAYFKTCVFPHALSEKRGKQKKQKKNADRKMFLLAWECTPDNAVHLTSPSWVKHLTL